MNDLQNVVASSDEAASVNQPTGLTYQQMMRKSAGIGRTKDARKLQALRNDIRALQAGLQDQVVEMEASVTDIADDLDRLARKDEITMIHGQIEKLDDVLSAVQAQVTELLSA